MQQRPRHIGILGAGQLARMMALAGLPLGCRFSLYDTSGAPSAGLGSLYCDPGNTQEHLEEFLGAVDVVTYEFEHLPIDLARRIESLGVLHPNARALEICQDREREKQLFTQLGIPTPAYRIVRDVAELEAAVEELGLPVVAKSCTQGYDGKGQAVIRDRRDCALAWEKIGHDRLIVEAFVAFRRELSLIAVRSTSGELAYYPLVENHHADGILRYTLAPAPQIDPALEAAADDYMRRLLTAMDYVGVLALELFDTGEGLLANEMAPRVHNSGHWSQNGAPVSQFENHLRAILGLPLGATNCLQPTCMVNLIGCDIDLDAVLARPHLAVHLYDKQPRPGRKVGHINVWADSETALHKGVSDLLRVLPDSMAPYPYATD